MKKTIFVSCALLLCSCTNLDTTTVWHENITDKEVDVSAESHDYKLIKYKDIIAPRQAILRGIEGYVDLELDIDVNGMPINIRVIDGENLELFSDAALKTAAEFRYIPRKIDGVNLVVPRVQYRLMVCFPDTPDSKKSHSSDACNNVFN